MLPLFNSHTYHSSQIQNDTTTVSAAQQVLPSNHCQINASNLMPNFTQIQPHRGIINPQMATPFNNSSSHFSNGNVGMFNGSISTPSPCFMNASNQNFPLQNGMSLLGPAGGMPHTGGFGPQNLNSVVMNQISYSQPPGQLFPQNSLNLPQRFNQNIAFPNAQFCLQSSMQNMNQFVQMQMPNYTQIIPSNLPLCPNQVSQCMVPQNPTFIANPQFGLLHANGVVQPGYQGQHRLAFPALDVTASKQLPSTAEQPQGNSPFGSVQPQKTQKFHSVFTKAQENSEKDDGVDKSKNNWKNSQNRNFPRFPKSDASHRGFTKSHCHHTQNSRGKFRFRNERGGKGYNNDGARKSSLANSTNQPQVEKKRSLSLNYTEQEIQQWREERKKNYPSKVNMEKKRSEKLTEPEVTERDAKLRRQQLKEILSKQAELGCEVAEIPLYYLSDSEKQRYGREKNKGALNKKERFQNKFNNRRRFRQNDQFAKKQSSADNDSSNVHDQNNRCTKKQRLAKNDLSSRPTMNQREPTLLQKLLSADIRRDKKRLLQVCRFMVMNSFFKEWPEKPLKYPLVVVRGTGTEAEVIEQKYPGVEERVLDCSEKIVLEKSDDDENHIHHRATCAQVKATAEFGREKGCNGKEVEGLEEEEGEIID